MTTIVKFPTWRIPLGKQEPLRRQYHELPKALVKINNEWLEVAVPSNELLRTAQAFYLGGYHVLSAAEIADLPVQYQQVVP